MTTTPTQQPGRLRVPPTTREILKRQAANAERELAQKKAAAAPKPPGLAIPSTAVTPAETTAVATPTRTPQQAYLDEIAPASIVGRMVKFTKDGKFATTDDGEPLPEGSEFIVLADQTLIGWVRFHDDAPPDRVMGLLYDGFVMPPRNSLGDTDEAEWPAGLSGAPADPWQHHIYLVLQQPETTELFTFVTSSITGRRAVGNLLRHYDRMRRTHPDELPVVRLKVGGYQSPRRAGRLGGDAGVRRRRACAA